SDLTQRAPFTGVGSVLSQTTTLSSSVHTGTLGVTAAIGAGLANEARANYSNQRIGTRSDLDAFGGAIPLRDELLFPGGITSREGMFGLYIVGAGQFNQGTSGIDEQRQVNLVDNLSLAKGTHQAKFGVDYRWLAPLSSPFSYREFVQFSGLGAAPGGALSGTTAAAATQARTGAALL